MTNNHCTGNDVQAHAPGTPVDLSKPQPQGSLAGFKVDLRKPGSPGTSEPPVLDVPSTIAPPDMPEVVLWPQAATAPIPRPPYRPSAAGSRGTMVTAIAAVAVLGIVITAAATYLLSRPESAPDQPARTSTGTSSLPNGAAADGARSSDSKSGQRPGRTLATPVLVPGPDGSTQHESCPSGAAIPVATGWPARSGRGTAMTSCQFTRNVGEAYWRSGPPNQAPRRVVASGAVECTLGRSLCENGSFVMSCVVVASQDWITCEGGRDAIVYLYGQ